MEKKLWKELIKPPKNIGKPSYSRPIPPPKSIQTTVMINKILFYIIIISAIPLDSIAQKGKLSLIDKDLKNGQKTNLESGALRTVKSYHVEENIKMNFGGYTTTYEVSDSSLIKTNDLGPNNTRIVTRVFTEKQQLRHSDKETKTEPLQPEPKASNTKQPDSLKKGEYAYVVMIKTYERVAEKGYKSVDIFQKLGNAFYFNNELEKAARWYSELFAMTSDLEADYYYRYSASLKAIGDNDKADEMLSRFYKLSDKNNSK